jgi:hypothetical protein
MTRKQWISLAAVGVIVIAIAVGYFVPRQGVSARNFHRLEKYCTRARVVEVLGKPEHEANNYPRLGWSTAMWASDDVVIEVEFKNDIAHTLELHPRTKK